MALSKMLRIVLGAISLTLSVASLANNNQPIPVKKDSFSMTLPAALTFAAPSIDSEKDLKVYSFTDNAVYPKQAMTVMVVQHDPQHMGRDLDAATRDFMSGILMGYAKRSGHPMTLEQAQKTISKASVNNRQFQTAQLAIPNGQLQVYSTHTDHTLYGFVFTSRTAEGVTEMRAALSTVKLFN